jgi:NADH:ubiquinone oxidoreductase subunit H
MACVYVNIFFGGGDFFFNFDQSIDLIIDIIFYCKVITMVFLFIFLRANLPRFRFDQLMLIG